MSDLSFRQLIRQAQQNKEEIKDRIESSGIDVNQSTKKKPAAGQPDVKKFLARQKADEEKRAAEQKKKREEMLKMRLEKNGGRLTKKIADQFRLNFEDPKEASNRSKLEKAAKTAAQSMNKRPPSSSAPSTSSSKSTSVAKQSSHTAVNNSTKAAKHPKPAAPPVDFATLMTKASQVKGIDPEADGRRKSAKPKTSKPERSEPSTRDIVLAQEEAKSRARIAKQQRMRGVVSAPIKPVPERSVTPPSPQPERRPSLPQGSRSGSSRGPPIQNHQSFRRNSQPVAHESRKSMVTKKERIHEQGSSKSDQCRPSRATNDDRREQSRPAKTRPDADQRSSDGDGKSAVLQRLEALVSSGAIDIEKLLSLCGREDSSEKKSTPPQTAKRRKSSEVQQHESTTAPGKKKPRPSEQPAPRMNPPKLKSSAAHPPQRRPPPAKVKPVRRLAVGEPPGPDFVPARCSTGSSRPATSNRYDYDEEEEDESELDSDLEDFIDDTPIEEHQLDHETAHYIKEIFGYDKSKYKDRESDRDLAKMMRTTFREQQLEDLRAAKLAAKEDREEMERGADILA